MVENYTYIKERILHLAEYKGVSKEKFLDSIGISYGSFKGKAKQGSINSDALVQIYTKYPDVSMRWLLTGEGEIAQTAEKTFTSPPASNTNSEMSKSTEENQQLTHLTQPTGSVPFYEDIDVTAGPDILFTDGSTQPTDYIHVPSFQDCDVAFPIWGDSMWPLYQSGQVILCKEFHDWRDYVPFGEVFLIITDNMRTIKYVRKAPTPSHLLLVSENKNYDDFELPKDHIRRMFFVKGAIKRNMI